VREGCAVRFTITPPIDQGTGVVDRYTLDIETYDRTTRNSFNRYEPAPIECTRQINDSAFNMNNGRSYSCVVSMRTLMSAPYFLTPNQNVNARATACGEMCSTYGTQQSTFGMQSAPQNIGLLRYTNEGEGIVLNWGEFGNDAGLSYEIFQYDDVNRVWETITNDGRFSAGQNSYRVPALRAGVRYSFKLKACNECDCIETPELPVMLANRPDPLVLITTLQDCGVNIQWMLPGNGGAPIDSYSITL